MKNKMKRIIVCIVTLFTSLTASATDLDLSLKGGATISRFSIDESENVLGFTAAFGGKFHIKESRFFIMPQAMYAQKGQKNEVVYNDQVTFLPVRYHMLEVPVYFGAQFNIPNSELSMDFAVGPYVAYDFRFNSISRQMDYVIFKSYRKHLSHGDVGTSFTFALKNKSFSVFYDYDLGLRDITQDSFGIDEKLFHRSMRIGVAFTFPTIHLGKKAENAEETQEEEKTNEE